MSGRVNEAASASLRWSRFFRERIASRGPRRPSLLRFPHGRFFDTPSNGPDSAMASDEGRRAAAMAS
jgi:hypothetical protein